MLVVGDLCVRTYVVNLRRRADRQRAMTMSVPARLEPIFTSDWEGPFDGAQLTERRLDGFGLFNWQLPKSTNYWWARPLKLGEVGCTISHISCWRHAAATGADVAVVLEDDVVIGADFVDQLHDGLATVNDLDPRWGLIYLGRVPLEPDRPVRQGIVRPGYSHCSFGYALSRRGLTDMLAARLDDAIIPVDEFLPAMYIDHPRRDVRNRFPRRLVAYAVEPPLVTQLPKEVAGSDTEDTRFVES